MFLLFVAVTAGLVVWSFRSGFLWTAICLIAVAAPLSLLYWYMLYVNPHRTSIAVAEEGLLLAAPPFASAVIPWASVSRVFRASLHDPELAVKKSVRLMNFAGYRSGIVLLESGPEAVIVANGPEVLGIQTEDRYYLLGPSDLDGLVQAVESRKPADV
ncbi:PH domain-containing protein [Pseudodesulfovibrio tunisiensis]|uniref:PH domain-containing protein n=1 Tax=Pseudodesulfovibrio tunisiensis TaxID=463192 RepID=UPI001FB40658|nr:PH domain-containing protein [Pseudodesulfovibrio tunisiensis]